MCTNKAQRCIYLKSNEQMRSSQRLCIVTPLLLERFISRLASCSLLLRPVRHRGQIATLPAPAPRLQSSSSPLLPRPRHRWPRGLRPAAARRWKGRKTVCLEPVNQRGAQGRRRGGERVRGCFGAAMVGRGARAEVANVLSGGSSALGPQIDLHSKYLRRHAAPVTKDAQNSSPLGSPCGGARS